MIRFGVFELDPASGELRRSGVRIRVQDQPLRILLELLARPNEVVTREELRVRIWPETFVDYDSALNTAVKKLRDALGDSAEAPRYIETIPKHGYRFVAPVEAVEALDAVQRNGIEPVAVPAPVTMAQKAVRPWVKVSVAAIAIAVLAVVLFFVFDTRGADMESIAVLPFVNLTGAATNDYVADGVTDSLISDLANLSGLRVISRTSAMQYRNATKPLPKIASELNVEGIIEGSVLAFGDDVRVEVKLIDASRDALLWSSQYQRPAPELDALQRDVAEAVAAQLRTRSGQLASAHAPDSEAHLLTLKGRHWLNDKRDGRIARQMFREAIRKDPTYAAPWAALAEAEVFTPERDVSPFDSLVRGKAAAEKALALDPAHAEAHASLGLARMFLDRDFAAAEQSFRRAIELKPGAVTAHHRYAQLLAAQGRFDEALAEAKRATELDPFSTLAIDDYGRALYFARRYDDALAQYERALAIDPKDQIATWFRVYALMAANRTDDAIEMIGDIISVNEREDRRTEVRRIYREGGVKAISRSWAEFDAAATGDAKFIRSTGIAARYAVAGETELAFQWLDRAYQSHTRDLVFLAVEPQFDSLRQDPRFAELMKKVGLKPVALPVRK